MSQLETNGPLPDSGERAIPSTARFPYSNEPSRGWLPWPALTPVLGILFVVLPALALWIPLERLGLQDAKENPIGFWGLLAFLVFPFAAMALVVFAWLRGVERRSLPTIGLGRAGGLRNLLRGHAIGIATSGAVVGAIALAGGGEAHDIARAFHSPRALVQITLLLLGFTLQSSAEEILFRGWLLSSVARRSNIAVGVTLSSLVFTLLHFGRHDPWLNTVNSALFALFAATLAITTNRLWEVMGWHSGWNWLLAVGFEQPVTGLDTHMPALLVVLKPRGPAWLTGGAQGPEGSVMCTAFFVIAIGWMLWRNRGRRSGA